ncbi:hypothetical protein L7F22_039916 [Adiantum nelumboides]|nr:hypothetical protein [Adiantum nelumboides]
MASLVVAKAHLPLNMKFSITNKRRSALEAEVKEWKKEMEATFFRKMEEWKEEKRDLCERISRIEEQAASQEAAIQILQDKLLAAKSAFPDCGDAVHRARLLCESPSRGGKRTRLECSATQKKVAEAEKWIEVAKKGKGKEAPCTPTLINMTLEEEQRRRMRALHVRITGLKDINNVEKEVTSLTSMMGVEKPSHIKAWRVGKKTQE